jgi:SAM-dependent methyltransferase
MHRSRDQSRIIRRSARRLYGSVHTDWPPRDGWNEYKSAQIERFIVKTGLPLISAASNVLDAGCGDGAYSWMPRGTVKLDRYYEQIRMQPNALIGDLERLPFRNGSFDLIFCIGSVLNYVSVIEALNELARVTAARGYLYLHFETSSSFEQIFSRSWNAPAYLNKTVNASRTDYIWIYSPSYIFQILSALGFRIIKTNRFHILSALFSKFGMPQDRAYRLARLDRAVPWLNFFADDVVILAEKT